MHTHPRGHGHHFIFCKVICGVLALAVVSSLVTMLLWNAILPGLFAFPAINFWQALGLLILTRLLFGGLFRFPRPSFREKNRNRLRSKWQHMTPEERKAFWHEWRQFGGPGHMGPEGWEAFREFMAAKHAPHKGAGDECWQKPEKAPKNKKEE